MTIEERVAAVERELEHLRELQRLREVNETLGRTRVDLLESELKVTGRAFPRLQISMKELEEAVIVTNGLLTRQARSAQGPTANGWRSSKRPSPGINNGWRHRKRRSSATSR
jgi:hypothetical protein